MRRIRGNDCKSSSRAATYTHRYAAEGSSPPVDVDRRPGEAVYGAAASASAGTYRRPRSGSPSETTSSSHEGRTYDAEVTTHLKAVLACMLARFPLSSSIHSEPLCAPVNLR